MDENHKRAYRYLLYWACCTDGRSTGWFRSRGLERWRPFLSSAEVRQIRRAGRVGDWLHNVAFFSTVDFVGFDEAWFWRDYESLVRDFGSDVAHYRSVFDRELVDPAWPRREGEGAVEH